MGLISLRESSALPDAVLRSIAAADSVPEFGVDPVATLAWARDAAGLVRPLPGGSPRASWDLLANTAYRSVAAARMLEPHLDALSIIAELEQESDATATSVVLRRTLDVGPTSTWGVFAAEGAGVRVEARADNGVWRLTGTKPWCSLAQHLSHALVTAWVDEHQRGLFAVQLNAEGVSAHAGPWHARGLADVVSAPVDFDDCPAVPVGPPGWYLTRPGFSWGGMAVAACWWGGAMALLEPLAAAAATQRADQTSRVHLGRADAALWAARAAISDAADLLAEGASGGDDAVLASRVRYIVWSAAETALRESDHALGPGPLVMDETHARRVADLHLYLRQHHADRDAARLGRDLAQRRPTW